MMAKRPLRFVVVGSGPSGFYAAESLLKHKEVAIEVDMIERLPTPFGLVRGGVAPDHQKIKNVIKVYERVASSEGFRFFGNIKLGQDLAIDDLRRHYDAVVFAVGAESDRKLGIPGEDLEGSVAATEFVGWYNSHPDHRSHEFNLECERVAVVGIGNVAMDVTRVLIKDPEQLAATDIAEHALKALRRSWVKEVVLLGRRGPVQAAFSPDEIKEIDELAGSELVMLPEEAELDGASREEFEQSPSAKAKKNVPFLQEAAKRPAGGASKKVHLRLCVSPVEIIGENGKVKAIKIEKNELFKDDSGRIRARGTGQHETIEVGMVLRSVGYYGIPIPGVPFDERKGNIPNDEGRVLDSDGKPIPGEYVVGWAKRGPSGLIGTNRADSVQTADHVIEDFLGKDLPEDPDKTAEAAERMLRAKQPRLLTYEDWKLLNTRELEGGKQRGKIREKFNDVAEMLRAIEKSRQGAA